jgi:hypothetical protein
MNDNACPDEPDHHRSGVRQHHRAARRSRRSVVASAECGASTGFNEGADLDRGARRRAYSSTENVSLGDSG